ncbi:TPA: hypothetical protein ACH3X2_005464 [Trebouxia sp. C0005]
MGKVTLEGPRIGLSKPLITWALSFRRGEPQIAPSASPAQASQYNTIVSYSRCTPSFLRVKQEVCSQAAMNTTKMALLFLSMIVLGATAHRLLEATSQKTGALDAAEEHQRILAELEEVHSLRERMLQQAGTYVPTNAEAPAPVPPPTEESPSALTEEAPPSESSGGGT